MYLLGVGPGNVQLEVALLAEGEAAELAHEGLLARVLLQVGLDKKIVINRNVHRWVSISITNISPILFFIRFVNCDWHT